MFDEFENKFAKESKKMNIFFSSTDSLPEKPYFCDRFTEMKTQRQLKINN